MYDHLAAENGVPAHADDYLKLAQAAGLGTFEHWDAVHHYQLIDYQPYELGAPMNTPTSTATGTPATSTPTSTATQTRTGTPARTPTSTVIATQTSTPFSNHDNDVFLPMILR